MNEMQQLSLTPDGTPEQAQAVGLHYEIVAAAQAAASSLLALGRKLKQMRDTGGYKRLGFETFADYTEQAVGIRQRQAYNYISVVENVPARLVEENAAAGVTKLAADRKAAEAHAAEQAKKEAERKARKQVAQAKAEAAQAAEKKLAEEREAARRDQEEKDKADLEAARQEAAEARAQAEETARKLQLTASEESIRFAMLFEQLQGAAGAMMDLVDDLTAAGRAKESDKLRTALTGALQALAEQVAV